MREMISVQLTLLKGKLHNAAVTQADLHYEGSIAIDSALMKEAGFLAHERVDIWNVNNGARFSTYVIPAPAGSRVIGLNGAAARNVAVGDRVIIAAFAQMDAEAAKVWEPHVVILDEHNRIKSPAQAANETGGQAQDEAAAGLARAAVLHPIENF